MSADETDNEHGQEPKRFICIPAYRKSDAFHALCAEIDAAEKDRQKASVADGHQYGKGPQALERRRKPDVYSYTDAPSGMLVNWYRETWLDKLSDEDIYFLDPCETVYIDLEWNGVVLSI